MATLVPGIKSTEELTASLYYLQASDEERDFSTALAGLAWRSEGSCVYCNHCLPCPSGIDIGRSLRLLDIAQSGPLGRPPR